MDIRISNDPKERLPLSVSRMRRALEIFLRKSRVRSAACSVVVLSSRAMRSLNRRVLGHDFVTDVITFDLRDDPAMPLEAEIFICPAEARRNARIYGEPAERELLRYLAHGILHLSGYDDATARERNVMRQKEDEMLSWLSSRPKR